MKLTDTLTGRKRDFAPAGDEVRIYVCGVTPYSPAHVGHAMSYIVFDVLHRYLEFRGFAVRRVQNFTDIDDKLIERAAQEGTTVEVLAEKHVAEYFENMAALNVREADVYPRATRELPKIIEMIAGLVASGHAYESSGDVYFRVRSSAEYGELSRRSLDAMRAGARVEPGVSKEHPMDFALWKSAKEGEPAWDSPWGAGRPGWHIECSAMALRYLGESIDIHGGGQDLVFPHHENEIAQSEAFTGKRPFARFWLHNGLLNMDAQKMSKSLGNLVTISEALERYSADAIRLSVLNAHYRSPGYYSDEALAGAERAAARLRQALAQPANSGETTALDPYPANPVAGAALDPQPANPETGAALAAPANPGADIALDPQPANPETGAALAAPANPGTGAALDPQPARDRFVEAMDDDLNTPQALAALFDLARDVNRASAEGRSVVAAQEMLRELAGVLGLSLREPETAEDAEFAARVEALVARRAELRAARDFAGADAVRAELAAMGVELADSPSGPTTWRRAAG